MMKDLYEVLGVACDAEDSAIRTAYRKLALRWHPGVRAERRAAVPVSVRPQVATALRPVLTGRRVWLWQ